MADVTIPPDSEDHALSNQQQPGESSAVSCEQDQFLPISNIGRIMKRALPANAKIAKDAKDTVQEFITAALTHHSRANDRCQREKRKTINGDDLVWAMGTLGFEDYIAPLTVYLHRYRELEGDSRNKCGSDATSKHCLNGHSVAPNAQM